MREGTVFIIGRPNVGKSTFLNNLIGQKVAITSPKPQTTRFPIRALYEDPRGKIIFVDTPGIFGRAEDFLSKKINKNTVKALNETVDVVLYMIDHTRRRDFEESNVLGIVRKINKPKILAINKIDLKDKTYLPQYKFMEEEFKHVFEISALKRQHLKPLVDKLFEFLPERKISEITHQTPSPLMNMDSKLFVGELIREKVFLKMGKEIPYTTTAIVDEISEKDKNLMYIKARILTVDDRYKRMLIGRSGAKIKEIGSMARREIELATGKKVYLDLEVDTDPHWQEVYFS
jgi:GTP-binding protein Era